MLPHPKVIPMFTTPEPQKNNTNNSPNNVKFVRNANVIKIE